MARLVSILWLLWSGLAWASLPGQTITAPAGTFTYGFNGAGRQLDSLQMPGSTTTFGYDAVGDQNLIEVQASGQTVDYHGYDYNGNGWITAARRRGAPNTISYTYGYDNIGQLTSVQSLEPDGSTPRLNETLGYTYDASDNLASRSTSNTLVQTFTSDALNQLASITRSGTLTVSGSLTGAVATLGVNGKAAIYSDGTFATLDGLTLRDGNNLFVTAGSNAAGTELAVPRVAELLADPAFQPLDQWLRQRQADVADLQAKVDQFLTQARQLAAQAPPNA